MVGSTHLRVGHGWTLAEYREAFQLLQNVPTCSRDLSDRLRQHARARLGRDGFGTPPDDVGRSVRPVPGWRSLRRVRPDLAAELHHARNGSSILAPWRPPRTERCGGDAATAGTSGRQRSIIASGAGQAVRDARPRQAHSTVEWERSLAVKRPDLAAELHPERNGGLDPEALGGPRRGACGGGVGAAVTIGRRWWPTGPPERAARRAGRAAAELCRASSGRSVRWLAGCRGWWPSCIRRATRGLTRRRWAPGRAGECGGPAARAVMNGRHGCPRGPLEMGAPSAPAGASASEVHDPSPESEHSPSGVPTSWPSSTGPATPALTLRRSVRDLG
jgi:hypothetical protein